MNKTNWKDIAELIGIAAIVASLVFVGMQMQQDRVHARAELGADSFSNLASISLEMTSDEFAPIFARAIEEPGELTTAERLQVNGYLEAFTYLILRDCYPKESRTIFANDNIAFDKHFSFFEIAIPKNEKCLSNAKLSFANMVRDSLEITTPNRGGDSKTQLI